MTRRFSGKFVVLSCPELTDSAMISIFGNLLQGFMASTGESSKTFSPEVRKSLRTCVEFVVRLYSATKQEIRATPLKSHYSFNVRDIARVVGGVFSTTPDEVTSLPSLVTLLVHESYRVFRDRLVDDKDCGTFDKVLLKNIWYFFEDRIVQFEQRRLMHPRMARRSWTRELRRTSTTLSLTLKSLCSDLTMKCSVLPPWSRRSTLTRSLAACSSA